MDCSPQAPLSMEFSRQEYWIGRPCPSPGDLPGPGIKPTSPGLFVVQSTEPLQCSLLSVALALCIALVLNTWEHSSLHAKLLPSHVQLFVTQWTVAHQVSPSMGFSRQEHWSRLPCPPPGDLPNPGIKTASLTSPVLAGSFFTSTVPFPYTLLVQVLAPLAPL